MKYMFKKLLFSLLAMLMIYSSAAMVYRIFEPQLDTNEQRDLTYLEYSTLQNYIISTGESSKHILFFCSRSDPNAVFVKDTVLSTVQSDTGLSISQIIEVADITNEDPLDIAARLYRDWGIQEMPAFLAVGVQNNACIVLDRLEWDESDPFTAMKIEDWLAANGFKTGVYSQ